MDPFFWESRLKNVFDSYELCSIKERQRKFEAVDNELLSLEFKEEEGISLRGIKDEKMAFSYTYEQGEKAFSALVENVQLIMPHLEADPHQVFASASEKYPFLSLWDDDGLQISDDEKIASLIKMESIIRSHDPRITATRNCELHESQYEMHLINSHGLDVESRKTIFTLGGMAVAKDADDEVSWYEWTWDTKYRKLDEKTLAKKIGEKTVSLLAGTVINTNTYMGLLPPGCACQLLEILSSSFLAENLFKNKSRLKDKIGRMCFSRLLSIIDSGLEGIDVFPFDGEGTNSQHNILVKDGIFSGFLYDAYYGKIFNHPSTGNGVRPGIKTAPRCDTRGLFIKNGTTEGLSDFSDGLVIEELMGTHTANEVTGDFSVGAIGHLRHGSSSIPFKGVILSGNLFEVLSHVIAVGNDLTFHGSYGSPSLVIEGLKISSS
jgi:PmbA protein